MHQMPGDARRAKPDHRALGRNTLPQKETQMKTFILAVLATLTIALSGGAFAADRMGTQTNSTFPEGSISQPN
jgi:hypothetical protein